MKTKLSLLSVVLLSARAVLLAVSGVGRAQPPGPYTVYVPVVSSECYPKVSAYASAYPPVVRVGEIMTLTGVIVNECSIMVSGPYFYISSADPQGVLSPTVPEVVGDYDVHIGEYRSLTLTLLAVGTGPVTITGWIGFESLSSINPPHFYWDAVSAQPIIVRVLPPPN